MMSKEIGSEFHLMPFENGFGFKFPRPGTLVFSGRTAIEAVLNQLPNARSALLPSYCCNSMIEPFRAAGIEVRHYDVNWNQGVRIDLNETADILLWCNYFGFKNEMPDFDGIIIEDITHSLLSEQPCHERSDHLVASVRKWEPILCGGYCSLATGGMAPSEEFTRKKSAAMELKSSYLEDLVPEKKPQFLQMFSDSNHWLAKHYSGLLIDPWSRAYVERADVKAQREIRRKNAHVLYAGLQNQACFFFPEEEMDCPLFVPILAENRDELRKYLISNGIYCPVHWPMPEGCRSDIYHRELSLICDQRYDENDMERTVSVLRAFLKKHPAQKG